MSEQSPASPVAGARPFDVAGWLVMLFLAAWIAGVAAVGYLILWVVSEFSYLEGSDFPRWAGAVVAVAQALLLALPLLPLARWWTRPRYRAVFRTWGWGAIWILFLAPLRLLEPTAALGGSWGQALLALLFILLFRFLVVHGRTGGQGEREGVMGALALAPLLLYPWFLWLAPGSPLGTLSDIVASLLFGYAAGLILRECLLGPLSETSRVGWNILLGGFAAGGLLVMMAAGYGVGGAGILYLVALPILGWTVVALAYWGGRGEGSNWKAAALFLGIAIAAPTVMVDPEEMALVLNVPGRDVLAWAFLAAASGALVGLLLGAVGLLLRHWLPRPHATRPWFLVAAVTWTGALLLFVVMGQPGFHGDRLFVILKEQADLEEVAQIENREARLSAAYEQLTAHATATQAPLRRSLDRFGVPYTPYYLVNAIEVRGGPLHRLWLETRPEVDRVLASPVLRPLPELGVSTGGGAAAPQGVPWNLSLIGADRVWVEFGVRGAGIVVGESDSGVQGDHPELADSYRGSVMGSDDYNWYDPWYNTSQPTDWGGHGTHTTGSVVGNRIGVAPDAEWIGCVNLARNLANPALYLDCLQFMLAPFPQAGDPFTDGDPTLAAHVLNNSWGCPALEGCDPTALLPAARALRAAGIFVVASAGNEGTAGCSTIRDPIALYDEVFSVGAVDASRALAGFSSRGPVEADGSGRLKPDIVAPGVDVLSAFPGSSYARFDGTSMAGPHVAGVVALMWSANPVLIGDIEQTEAILTSTAQPARQPEEGCGDGEALPNNLVGYGMVDAYAAVERALEVAAP